MSIIYSYLTFYGNCREAMNFYQTCLGGELMIQTVGDTPLADSLPVEFRELILKAILKKEKLVLIATDMTDHYLMEGNTISMLLFCEEEKEARNYYKKLSHGGEKTSPLTYNQAGSLTGTLTYKYGHPWIIHFSTNYTQPNLNL